MAELKHVKGLSELLAALDQLPDNVSKNVLRGMVNAGATVIKNEARAMAPVDTGALRQSIIQKHIPEKSNKFVQTYYVTVRSGPRFKKIGGKLTRITGAPDAFYWRFLEFGTKKMAAKPFMRPAFETRKYEAIEAMKVYGEERVVKELKKIGFTVR